MRLTIAGRHSLSRPGIERLSGLCEPAVKDIMPIFGQDMNQNTALIFAARVLAGPDVITRLFRIRLINASNHIGMTALMQSSGTSGS